MRRCCRHVQETPVKLTALHCDSGVQLADQQRTTSCKESVTPRTPVVDGTYRWLRRSCMAAAPLLLLPPALPALAEGLQFAAPPGGSFLQVTP